MLRLALGLGLASLVACVTPGQYSSPTTLRLVRTVPLETSLGAPELSTADAWHAAFEAAEVSLELAYFYASDQDGSRLTPVIEALERAAARGVQIRFLSDERFYGTYPETLDRLAALPGVEVRRYDLAEHTGGVLHTKCVVIDGRRVLVGSANFDWRSLEHIHELGVLLDDTVLASAFAAVFEFDWRLANPDANPAEALLDARAVRAPLRSAYPVSARLAQGGDVLVTPVFSPETLLPQRALWDLPELLDWLQHARERIRLQLLDYKTVGYDKTYWPVLENALREAATRGVRVELLLSNWCQRSGTIEGLQSLQAVPNIEVRLVTIPQASTGFVPFARVIHAKSLVVDNARTWIGTANWSKDYFHSSRNAGLLIEGAAIAQRVNKIFDELWSGPYAAVVDPAARYEAPRIGP